MPNESSRLDQVFYRAGWILLLAAITLGWWRVFGNLAYDSRVGGTVLVLVTLGTLLLFAGHPKRQF